MFNIPYEKIIEKIKEKTNLSEEEIENRIKEKINQLSGLVSKEGAAHIIANELGIDLFEKFIGKLEIKNILEGMRNVEVVGKVIRKFEIKEFERSDGNKGKVGALILADETGSIRVVFWNDQINLFEKINVGDILKIKNAYVRRNTVSQNLELQLNERSSVEINPEGEEVNVTIEEPKKKKLSEINEQDNLVDIIATIVNVFDIRFFETCPECGKRLKTDDEGNFFCDLHGVVEPKYRAVLNMIVDDGSDTIRVVLFNNQIMRLLNQKEEEIIKYKDDPLLFEEVKKNLLGTIIKVIGRVSKNELFERLEIIANQVFPNPSPEEIGNEGYEEEEVK